MRIWTKLIYLTVDYDKKDKQSIEKVNFKKNPMCFINMIEYFEVGLQQLRDVLKVSNKQELMGLLPMLRGIIVEELETGTSVINLIQSIFMLSIYTD